MWNAARRRAAGERSAAPNTMYESWLMVEYARRNLRLSWTSAKREATRIVVAATARRMGWRPRPTTRPGPRKKWSVRRRPNTPAFTTATAWRRPLTGVGAIIADGSHPWRGTRVALTPKPATRRNATAWGTCVGGPRRAGLRAARSE